MSKVADQFCQMVSEEPDISNAAARFGAWLIGAAERTGGFPVELSVHQIRQGFERNGVHVDGMGGRYETINNSISWLEGKGYLAATDGKPVGFGYSARHFSITL